MREPSPDRFDVKRWWRAGGLLSGALALSFLWTASRLSSSFSFPPISLAERIIRLTPGDVATFFIDWLGHNAIRLLGVGTIVGFLSLAAALPQLTARARPYLAGLLLAAASIGAAAVDPVSVHPIVTVIGSVAAGALYAVPLSWFLEIGSPIGEVRPDPSRRRAVISLGAATAGFALGGTALGRIARRLAGPRTLVPIRAADEPAQLPDRPNFPDIPGLSPEITSTADHYVVDIDLLDPVVEAVDWTLSVHGLVDRPLRLTFSELQRRFRLVEEYAVLTCISNPVGGELVGSSSWTGVRVGEVLADAGLQGGAVDVVFRCADGYSDSLPAEAALDPSVILAVAQDGRPLAWEHGFPCRVRAPAVYGMKNVKWIQEIEIVATDYKGYWERRGWSDVAIVRTESRIDTAGKPAIGQPTWIAGVAWAGDRGVSRVEVSVNDGRTWSPATLNPHLSPLAWSQWAYRWTPDLPGTVRILCRATDGNGRLKDRATAPSLRSIRLPSDPRRCPVILWRSRASLSSSTGRSSPRRRGARPWDSRRRGRPLQD